MQYGNVPGTAFVLMLLVFFSGNAGAPNKVAPAATSRNARDS